MSEWINVGDTLPEDGERILTWNGIRRCIDVFIAGESENFKISKIVDDLDSSDPKSRPVTHWTPLPEPPED